MQLRAGRGENSSGVIRTDPVPVTRLTIVTMIEAGDWAVELPHPLLLRAGERVWVEGATFFVRRPDGAVIRHDGDGLWLCR